ncbi:MAG: tetratricopeptide repeat protein, partial [Acidobacteriota bacterium]
MPNSSWLAMDDPEGARRAQGAFFELVSRIEIPAALERSVRGQVEGAVAYARGDWAEAAERLRVGLEDMPDRRTSEQAITIRYQLARALERLGRTDEALEQYRAIVDARLQRLGSAISWVRTLDHLASILDARGDADEAERLWARYLELWGDGEIDAERVAEVRARLG